MLHSRYSALYSIILLPRIVTATTRLADSETITSKLVVVGAAGHSGIVGNCCAGDIAEADVGAEARIGGSGGAGMAGAVGVGGRDDGIRDVCCCVFTLGLPVRCGVLVRRVGGGGKEAEDDRDVGV